jgi:hypothetical protein
MTWDWIAALCAVVGAGTYFFGFSVGRASRTLEAGLMDARERERAQLRYAEGFNDGYEVGGTARKDCDTLFVAPPDMAIERPYWLSRP